MARNQRDVNHTAGDGSDDSVGINWKGCEVARLLLLWLTMLCVCSPRVC